MIRTIAIIVFWLWPWALWADLLTAPSGSLLQRPTGAFIQVRQVGLAPAPGGRASLFVGQSGSSLFAPLPPRPRTPTLQSAPRLHSARLGPPQAFRGTAVERIRQLIQHAESRRDGYDAVQYGARIKPAKRPTDMTLAEIFIWIDDTPGQPHAIGRYQFIPTTLRDLVKRLKLPHHARFSPDVQDRLADILLSQAGLHDVQSGKMARETFMNNLAKIWAGFPTDSGKSYYHGYAGNKASITWAQYSSEMARIFPG